MRRPCYREVHQQQRLGEADALELREVQPLVGAVCTRVRVLDAGDQHARLREALQELGDERDRPAHPHVDRTGPVPGLGERVPRCVVRRTRGVDHGGLAGVDDGEAELGTPGHMRLEVRAQALERALGGVARGDPQRDPGARTRDQGVAGPVDLGRVQAGDRQRRLVHSRSTAVPEPMNSASAPPRTRRGAAPRVVDVGRRSGVQARDRDVALVVVQRGDQPAQRHQGVGHQPCPTCRSARRGSACALPMSTRTSPRRLVVRAGTPMSQLAESAITMTSAAR